MPLGAALLNPQLLARTQAAPPAQAFADDLLALACQVLASPAHAQDLGSLFTRAFEDLGRRLHARLEARLTEALAGAQALLAPLTAHTDALAESARQVDGPLGALTVVEELLDAALAVANNLSEGSLRDLARQVHALATGPLGLSQDTLAAECAQVFAQLREDLLAGSAALDAPGASVRYALVALLRRIETELLPSLPKLDLSPDRVAQAIYREIARTGFEKVRGELVCLVEKLKAALTAGRALGQLASGQPFGSHSLGAGEALAAQSGDQYCWYASWLFATEQRGAGIMVLGIVNQLVGTLFGSPEGFPANQVWMSADRTQLILRRPLQDDVVLHTFAGGNGRWQDAPQFAAAGADSYTFGVFGQDFLEFWAQLSAALGSFGKSVLHTIALATSPKEYAANTPLAIWHLTQTLGSSLGGAPLPALITRAGGLGVGFEWLYTLVPWLAVGLGSLEGKHTEATGDNIRNQWLTLYAGDALGALGVNVLPGGILNTVLAVMTLINQQGPATAPNPDTRPRNRENVGPLVSAAVALILKFVFFPLIPREEYHYPDGKFFGYWLLAILTAVGTGLVTVPLGWLLARTVQPGQLGLSGALYPAIQALVSFPIQYYQELEGDTDGGKYNPTRDASGTALAAAPPFKGYPDHQTSPYRLPWERGTALYVSQGNEGMFSHMRLNDSFPSQVYAYDFAHDYGQEVLASRAGTVVDFYDWIEDNTDPDGAQKTAARTASNTAMGATWRTDEPGWNYVLVRHDAVVPDHDTAILDASITATWPCTYAVYGHGKKGSVRAAFAARGLADPKQIIGTAVQQGHVLMGADDTGFSFHSHVHMHVCGGPASPAAPPAAPVAPIAQNLLSPFSFPFVFKEVTHVLARNGVPKALCWYTSDNERAG